MKKALKVLGIIIFSAFLLLPLKTYAQEAEWSQELDLNDSVSSAIAKVEDGVVVMQYEGVASANNLLIKYDFNGKKIWEIDNDYGYNIESVSDGFIVWSEEKITKFDKDKNILWSKDIEYKNENNDDQVGGLGNKLIELKDGYIIGQTTSAYDWGSNNDFIKIDLNGNVKKRLSQREFISSAWNCGMGNSYIFALGKSLDGNSIIVVGKCYKNDSYYTNISILSSDLILQSHYEDNLSDYVSRIRNLFDGWNLFNDVIETKDGYVLAGRSTVAFNKEGKFKETYDKIILDIKYINDNIYGYLIDTEGGQYKNSEVYKTAIVKYDTNFQEIDRINLDFSFNYSENIVESFYYNTGFSQIKNRIAYYANDNTVNFMTLNTPINTIYRYKWHNTITKGTLEFDYSKDVYELSSYKFKISEPTKDDNNSGIINSIIKNPQTNSIIIIAVFVVLVLAISTIIYITYRQKNKKHK